MRDLGLVFALVVGVITTVAQHPTEHDTLAQEPLNHPRLFFTQDQVPELRAKATSTHRGIWDALVAFADEGIGTKPDPVAPEDGSLNHYRNAGNRMMALALVCVVSGEEDYCQQAKNYLLTYATHDQWGEYDWRDLGLAHMLMGNALAYDWLYQRLTPEEQRLVRHNLFRFAHYMYEASTTGNQSGWRNWWSQSYVQNHYWITNSALGVTGLALLGEEDTLGCPVTPAGTVNVNLRAGPGVDYVITGSLAVGARAAVINSDTDASGAKWWQLEDGNWVRSDLVTSDDTCEAGFRDTPQDWVDQARNRIAIGAYLLEGIADGSWHEGMAYQTYLLTMTLPFLVNLRLIEDADIFPHTYLRNYTSWRIYNHLPDTLYHILPNGDFEWDEVNTRQAQNILRFAASEYDDGRAEWMAQYLIKYDGRGTNIFTAPWYVFEFLYYDPAVKAQPPDDLPLTHQFNDLEAVVWRTGWQPDDLVFGFKSGAWGGRFAFDTFTQGRFPWNENCFDGLCQLNAGHDHDDTNSFYIFKNEAWLVPEEVGNEKIDTTYHNTLLIDGQGQYRPPSDDSWRDVEDFLNSDGYLQTAVSASDFSFLAANATRRYWETEDLENFTRYVVFVAPDYFVMVDNLAAGSRHTYESTVHFGESAVVEDNWVKGNALDDQILAVGIVAPSDFDTTTGKDGQPFVRIRPAEPVEDVRLAYILYPTTEDDWNSRPDFALLDDTDRGIAIRVMRNDGSGRTEDIIIVYGSAEAKTEVGSYSFDGQVAVVRRDNNGDIESLFVYGGTELTLVESETGMPVTLVTTNMPDHVFQAQFSGDAVDVESATGAQVSLFAPSTATLTVDGQSVPYDRADNHLSFAVP
jgi:hypothetical protein